ncbi:nuclear pore complex protein Nup98-Nup96 isoform X2 [Bombyx mori]|uniref:Nuclear pore complex protein Nup98-Nup96 n=1 Tax=Bombyx mori TaxID=7091 RepID=A0A8R2LZA8_BOMMO|nr:nuclear pore complex protein Nup98-Nup96 [Bombyx mori]XP_037869822.1 nuclear pore complex protein Nup98-Nup96 [Bombyx mori]XP_037869823.1 nuclear pore complex protein Nup98-Nup96 [Bombyx mori]
MFPKQTFGSNATSGFGSFNSGATTSSPFGGFKPATGSFGASTSTQPATGGGLFANNTSGGGLFGNPGPSTSTSAFGTSTTGFGFGGGATSGGLFGNTSTAGGGLFGNTQATPSFGVKPTGFGFSGSTTTGATTGNLFGTPATGPGAGLFAPQGNTMSGGGLFGGNTSAGAFGQQQPTGTGHVKFNPVVGTEVVMKNGTSQNINIKHHCITFMKEYEGKSLEELRLEDYMAGRKGSTATTGMFGGFQQTTENKPLFGSTGFGQPATTSAPGMFGTGSGLGTSGAFGQNSTFSFGGNTNTTTTGLFGANKPPAFGTSTAGSTLFNTTTTQAPAFGASTNTFGFGANTQNQSTGIFGAKPATGAFGTTPASSGFGSFSGGGAPFAAKTTAPAFGTTTSAFGSMAPTFGSGTQGGGLFGQGTAFGKPATTQPSFSFAASQPAAPGLGAGAGGVFQGKPAAPSFGTLGLGTFQQQPANTFKTDGVLGGGMFGNNNALGSGFGLGSMNANNSLLANNSLSGASAGGNVHEQILTMAARPYGDSPLFKDLLPDSTTAAEDILKPTNPLALKAVLDGSHSAYRINSPTSRVQPRQLPVHKKSLFDGLEESDSSLEDKLCLKPSRKRLVLRARPADGQDEGRTNRSFEQPSSGPGRTQDSVDQVDRSADVNRNKSTADTEENGDLHPDKHSRWINSPKISDLWTERDHKPDAQRTNRMYPDIEKEVSEHISERRASWLSTKPLRAGAARGAAGCAESSVRELGGRSASPERDRLDSLSVSEDENVEPRDAPPHPTGVKLTRPGYYTIPSLDDMINYMRPDGTCPVPHLTIGRKNYGNVYYDSEIDVAGLDLDALVHFLNKEVIVYPEDSDKPPVGVGLNRRAIVTLDRVWPRDKTEKRLITEPDRLLKLDYEGKLRRVCEKHDTKFIEYRPQTGSWVFRVEHFSKYGLTDSDEEDDPTPDVLKRQLLTESLQKASAPGPKSPVNVSEAGAAVPGLLGPGHPGLGGSGPPGLLSEDSLYNLHHTSLLTLNGTSKAFDVMDTAEDNAESQSLFLENRAFGVKSPTSELARLENRRSHSVQLMKASLYPDEEMDDDVSVSTGEQLVPNSAPIFNDQRLPSPSLGTVVGAPPPPPERAPEPPMRPLTVQPHTIVLKYHRKVPPFKDTIAGRLDSACLADMSVSHARHSRVGFGPASTVALLTTYDAFSDLPRSSELSSLDRYLSGRASGDWSERLVARLALAADRPQHPLQEILEPHISTLLEWSTLSECAEDECPRLSLRPEPEARLAVLRDNLRHSSKHDYVVKFGVSAAYCREVWRLCDALWGADLENGGIPGTDEQSIVNRHKKLLRWFEDAVAGVTDAELAEPRGTELEDESDTHSARIWTLLLGGRTLEACKLARDSGDLNMAMLLAQAGGDAAYRGLVARQLAQWSACGADTHVAGARLHALRALGGAAPPALAGAGWLRALHATARYICPQIPSLEKIIRTYEGFFSKDEQVDLTSLGDDVDMRPPLPDYNEDYCYITSKNGNTKAVLDLRYELIRARAFNQRPKLKPAAYTPDPNDFTLCFLLGAWFGSPSVESVVSVAEQLEAGGAWQLATAVLAYHPHGAARSSLVRSMISRHAPSSGSAPGLQLLERIGVPEKWIHLARAHRAKYEHQPALEVEHLLAARQWSAAHRVLLDELLPDAVLNDDLQTVSRLLKTLEEAAERHEVADWESGGLALSHYIHVCDEIMAIQNEGDQWGRLEALRPRLAAACRALPPPQHMSPRVAAARAQMGGRLLRLTLSANLSADKLASLVAALKLPPDCSACASHKITTELAERRLEGNYTALLAP